MMKKSNLAKMFSECLSMEEIPMISNLEELRDIVSNSNLGYNVKAKMMKSIGHLITDTLKHAKIVTSIIKETIK